VVIHSTGVTLKLHIPAKNTARFFESCANDSGSTQAIADEDEGYKCVLDREICAGAPPANTHGVHIEQPGTITDPRSLWLSVPDQIERVSFWTAKKCHMYDIPAVLLHEDDLPDDPNGIHGITYHEAISKKYKQSTHTDPGPGFPWDVFMSKVREYMNRFNHGIHWEPYPGHLLREGSEEPAVIMVKKRLAFLGLKGFQPGDRFGQGLRAAVERFQHDNGLDSDGIIGPMTWAAIWSARKAA
jgi:hypothetical protein